MKDSTKRDENKESTGTKCKVCGRPLDEHHYRITTFECGIGNEIHPHTVYADDYTIGRNYLWLEDDCVKTGKSLNEIQQIVITNLYKEVETCKDEHNANE